MSVNSLVYPPSYQAADALALQPIAALANGDISEISFIPGGWKIIKTLAAPSRGAQMILVVGSLKSMPGQKVAVLAMGQRWSSLLSANTYATDFPLKPLPVSLGGSSGTPPPSDAPLFCSAYVAAYQKAEPPLFDLLKQAAIATQVAGLPLIVIGQAIGAPLAQLAAMAFRKLRSDIPIDLHTAACYTFSTPPMGDAYFASLLTGTIPACFNVYAAGIDFFASPPTPFLKAVRAGIPQPLSAAIPTLQLGSQTVTVDDAWREHSGAFYTELLGGTTFQGLTPGSVNGPPPGYSADLAYTLTLLISVAYQQSQHPDLPPAPAVNYPLDSYIAQSGTINTRWGAIFLDTANQRIFVIFRGEICLEESVRALTQLGGAYPAYLPNNAMLTPGVEQVYSSLRDGLRANALKALSKVGGSTIIMAGHGLGGVLANVAALDFSSQGGGLSAPSAIYTYGAPPSGDGNGFIQSFTAAFAGTDVSSFQLRRTGDPFPTLTAVPGGGFTMPQALSLSGGTPYDDSINHSLSSYIVLLKAN